MNIGILTFHGADNYGAVLQAYALQKKLEIMGNNVKIIDYYCPEIENVYAMHIYDPDKKFISNVKHFLLYIYNYTIGRKRKFISFRKRLNLSVRVDDSISKSVIEREVDLILTGSDQIWNTDLTHGINNWYFYKRGNGSNRLKVGSYAASFGSVNVLKNSQAEILDILSEYDFISVREHDAMKALSDCIAQRVYCTIDPTLLHDGEFWDELAGKKRLQSKPYVFYYDASHNPLADMLARQYADDKGLNLVRFDMRNLMIGKVKGYIDAGPIQFLNLLKNADCVITSSFHATVFSILFHKDFVVALHPKTGMRCESLLSELGLLSRIVKDGTVNLNHLLSEKIEYDEVEKRIIELRMQSEHFLSKCINE